MPCYWVPPGVRFNDYLFTEPVPLAGWRPPADAGIIAILARNSQWAPKPFQPLYFGEMGNAGEAVSARAENLFVSVLPMPFSSATQRRALSNELISAYRVVSTSPLAQRVEQLEARQQEQSQQILSLLSFIGKLFEPQPVAPRRPIGFLPVTEAES